MEKILLIDAMNSIYRAKVSFAKKEEGQEDFNIVFNFFRNLRAHIEEFRPTKVFFCLEGKNSFRKEIYGDYKANRIIKISSEKELKSKEDFNRQKDIILNLLRCLPITQVYADRFEADDVLITLSFNLKDEEVIIVSNDGDLIQILQKGLSNVKIYNPFKKQFVENPDYHVLTFKCFGDKSDNVPKLASEKKAIEFASDPKKLLEFLSIEENRANYNLNKQLVELQMVPEDQLQFIECKPNFDYLRQEFNRMEFKTMVNDDYWERFVETFSRLTP
jgi:5'-3' exonuclease